MPHDFKNILVDLVPQREGPEHLTAATRMGLVLGRQSKAFLTIHFLSPRLAWVPVSLITNLPAQLAAEENRHLDETAKTSLALAGAAATAAGISYETETIALDFLALLGRSSRKARLQDVVVMDAHSFALPHYHEIVEGMLFRSGRPVILMPKEWDGDAPRRIAIAWDGSVPAARAVAEALPLLQKAETVAVLTVQQGGDQEDRASSDRLARYLGHHGIEARQDFLTADGRDVAAVLRDHVAQSGAQMLVMGAYAHSRLQEAILGGVTRSFLEECPVPMMMAH